MRVKVLALSIAVLLAAAGTAASTVVRAASASPSSVPLPPFAECPTVNASPSCEILIVVNPDSTVSVWGDPSVGPYDGGDDTLVGIVNESSAAVDAVTVTGPGSGLGLLDGD